MHNRILKSTAVHNPSTLKPSTSLSANNTIKALIIKRNKPNVRIVTGKVRMTKIGFTKRFKTDRTIATIKAPRYPLTDTPFNNSASAKTASAFKSSLIISFIVNSVYCTAKIIGNVNGITAGTPFCSPGVT